MEPNAAKEFLCILYHWIFIVVIVLNVTFHPGRHYIFLHTYFCLEAFTSLKMCNEIALSSYFQAIDPRTRMVLFKMLNQGIFNDINGCISTGKEAKGNRNRVPDSASLERHVLVMEFIVHYCIAADIAVACTGYGSGRLGHTSAQGCCFISGQIIMAMRIPYLKCKLVHGDLSEYNILYFEGHLHIIDVSQAVDLDHPHALDFLWEDCVHFFDFFKKHGVAVMTIRELFDFIVDPSINDDSVDSYLEEVQQKILARDNVISAQEEIADSVFMQSYIPKTIDHVNNVEEDVQRLTCDTDTGDMYYQTITGLKQALSISDSSLAERQSDEQVGQPVEDFPVPGENPGLANGGSRSGTDGHESDSTDTEEQEDSSSEGEQQAAADRKAARKENKKKVKEEEGGSQT